jgi:hypothetical protein
MEKEKKICAFLLARKSEISIIITLQYEHKEMYEIWKESNTRII